MTSNAPPKNPSSSLLLGWKTGVAGSKEIPAKDNLHDLFRGWDDTNRNSTTAASQTTHEEKIECSPSSDRISTAVSLESTSQEPQMDLLGGSVPSPPGQRFPRDRPAASAGTSHPAWPNHSSDERFAASSHGGPTSSAVPSPISRPGDESVRYVGSRLKNIGGAIGKSVMRPLREMQLAEKLNALNIESDELEVRRQLEQRDGEKRERVSKEELEEMERMKRETVRDCQRVGERYDSLVFFIELYPKGAYTEFVDFLFEEDSKKKDGECNGNARSVDDHNRLMYENFYDKNSEYRKLWNDNLTLGLSKGASTVDGRAFVPAAASYYKDQKQHFDPNIARDLLIEGDIFNLGGAVAFREQFRQRTLSETERIKNIASRADGRRLRKLGSAVTSVSSMALRPLREFQLAEKLNAANLDAQDDEKRRAIAKQRNREEFLRQESDMLEDMMKLKHEAQESCLMATREHLMNFILTRPKSTYEEWIEELHPENAHDGTLLEGLGKTIDHRFFVEESDHRRLWNDNIHAFLAPGSPGRTHVTPRASQLEIPKDLICGSIGTNTNYIALKPVESSGGSTTGSGSGHSDLLVGFGESQA